MRIAPVLIPHLRTGGRGLWADTALAAMLPQPPDLALQPEELSCLPRRIELGASRLRQPVCRGVPLPLQLCDLLPQWGLALPEQFGIGAKARGLVSCVNWSPQCGNNRSQSGTARRRSGRTQGPGHGG